MTNALCNPVDDLWYSSELTRDSQLRHKRCGLYFQVCGDPQCSHKECKRFWSRQPSQTAVAAATARATDLPITTVTTTDAKRGEQPVPKDAIMRLARLQRGTIEYDLTLDAVRKSFGPGVRKATIEALVAEEKTRYASQKAAEEEAERQRRIAAAGPVDGSKLLRDIDRLIDTFVELSRERRLCVATWILHTHAVDAAHFTPYLHIRSPLKRCGKTLLERISMNLVAKPQFASTITSAALVDKVAAGCTLLLDEVDAVFGGGPVSESTETKRAILNSGYERSGRASKMTKDTNGNWISADYVTFCPKMVAGIGRLPDTIQDRSLTILMLRKPKGVAKDRFILTKSAKGRAIHARLTELRSRIELWASQNLQALAAAEPAMPGELDDRATEICEPLVAIADVCGGEWPAAVRKAIVAVRSGQTADDNNVVTDLLTDIRRAFTQPIAAIRDGKISTRNLALWLASQERWEHFHGRGQPLQRRKLLSLLRDLEISQHSVRIDGTREWGFEAADFEQAFESCLPAVTGDDA